MSNTKTGLLYSELTGRVYWGTVNLKTSIARSGKKDVTSDFISVMLQKFPVGNRRNIECNGEIEAVIYVVDEKMSHRLNASKEMYEMLISLENDDNSIPKGLWDKIQSILAKARGEHD